MLHMRCVFGGVVGVLYWWCSGCFWWYHTPPFHSHALSPTDTFTPTSFHTPPLSLTQTLVAQVLERVWDKGDIYPAAYEGYYCVDCEEYKDEGDMDEHKNCPTHRKYVVGVYHMGRVLVYFVVCVLMYFVVCVLMYLVVCVLMYLVVCVLMYLVVCVLMYLVVCVYWCIFVTVCHPTSLLPSPPNTHHTHTHTTPTGHVHYARRRIIFLNSQPINGNWKSCYKTTLTLCSLRADAMR